MINYLMITLLFYQAPFLKAKISNYNSSLNQLLFIKNLTRIKRYNFENDYKWRQELRQKEQDLIRRYFAFQNANQEDKKKYHYYRIPRVMRQKWIYEYYGRIAGLILAVCMAFAHHFFAFAYAIIVWIIRRRNDIKFSTNVFAPKPPRRNRHYEELQHMTYDKAAQLLEMTQSETQETFISNAEKEFNNLLKRGMMNQLKNDEVEKIAEKQEYPIEGIIPFHLIGIPGPYGERIVDKAKPIRDPLPDEKPPIIYNIEELPQHFVTDKQGFFGLVDLAKKETVIIKTNRTADGHLKGYFGGRFIEENLNKNYK